MARISRRRFVQTSAMAAALAGIAGFYGPWKHNRAYAQGKPIKLGLTNDASGQFGNSGRDEHRAIRMAIDEQNAKGGVLGRKIEWITADTESVPAVGTRIAERFITREDCAILIGALISGVANAITQVANKYGTLYLNTNSSAPSEAAENCSRIKFVWDGNGSNFIRAAVKNAVGSIGKNWVLLTNDYVYGHSTAATTKGLVEAAGGRIVENLLVPQNTRDFTAYLLKIQQLKPDVVVDRDGRRRQQGAARAGGAVEARRPAGVDRAAGGLARRVGRAAEPVGRVRHHLVPQPQAPRRGRVREALAGRDQGRLQRHAGAGQRLLQRLHRDAGALPRNGARRLDQQHQDHPRARGPEDAGGRPHAALRRLHPPGDPPGATRPSTSRARTRSRRTTPTTSRSSPGRSRSRSRTTPRPGKCKLVPHEQVRTVDA